jgi:hypothetical protein
MSEFGRWEYLFATLIQAQIADADAIALWRGRLHHGWPDYSWELAATGTGGFAPGATAEQALWRESHAKAGLPYCATAEQITRLQIKPLPECTATRDGAVASVP